jgi:hypothetical protein
MPKVKSSRLTANDNSVDGEFTVFWWDLRNNIYRTAERVNAIVAMNEAEKLAKARYVKRVMITNSEGETEFEWQKGKGVTHGV